MLLHALRNQIADANMSDEHVVARWRQVRNLMCDNWARNGNLKTAGVLLTGKVEPEGTCVFSGKRKTQVDIESVIVILGGGFGTVHFRS